MDNLELVSGLKKQLSDLPWRDESKLDALRRRTEMIIRNVFGPTSKYLKDLSDIDFYPMVYPTTAEREREAWQEGRDRLLNLLNTVDNATDITPSPDNGTLNGGATVAPGEVAQAFSLNGTTAYVSAPDVPKINFGMGVVAIDGAGGLSIDAWIKTSNANGASSP